MVAEFRGLGRWFMRPPPSLEDPQIPSGLRRRDRLLDMDHFIPPDEIIPLMWAIRDLIQPGNGPQTQRTSRCGYHAQVVYNTPRCCVSNIA